MCSIRASVTGNFQRKITHVFPFLEFELFCSIWVVLDHIPLPLNKYAHYVNGLDIVLALEN